MRRILLLLLVILLLLLLSSCYEGRVYVVRLCDGTRVTVRDLRCRMTDEGAVFCESETRIERSFGCVLELTRER